MLFVFPVVQIYLKAPRSGAVKTRLSADIGAAAALAAYREMVERTLQAIPPDWAIEVYFAPGDAENEMREWLDPMRDGLSFVAQSDGDLGERLLAGVQAGFERTGGPVICIGGDCPWLRPDLLEEAWFTLNEGCDVVFGPTLDGGYYLIGLSGFAPAVFTGIPWSTTNTLAASIRAAEAADLGCQFLETLRDVDTIEDWQAWQDRKI